MRPPVSVDRVERGPRPGIPAVTAAPRRQKALTHYVKAIRRRTWTSQTMWIYQAPRATVFTARPDITIERATAANLADTFWFQKPHHRETPREYLDRGDRGYLAYMDGVCVHQSWVASGPGVVREHWSQPIRLSPGEGFLHYAITAPPARGRGVFGHVLAAAVNDHSDLRLTMAINAENAPSHRAASKAGWRRITIVTYRVVAGRRRSRRAAAP